MLVGIKFDPATVVTSGDGFVLLDIEHHGQFASAATLSTVQGKTAQDFEDKSAKSVRTVLVKSTGGITF